MAILCISNANLVPELKFPLAPPLLVGGPPPSMLWVLPMPWRTTTSWWAPTATSVPSSVSLASMGRRSWGERRSRRGASRPWAPLPGLSSLWASLFHWIFNSFFARHSCEVILTVSTTEVQCSPFLERKRQKCYSVMKIGLYTSQWL